VSAVLRRRFYYPSSDRVPVVAGDDASLINYDEVVVLPVEGACGA
jgi:hypothetical protein